LSPISNELQNIPTIEEPPIVPNQRQQSLQNNPEAVSSAGRGAVRKWLEKASIYISDAAHDSLDTSDFADRRARTYPAIPGEDLRNTELHRTSTQYDNIRERSRAASYAPSTASASGIEGGPVSSAQTLSRSDTSPGRTPVRRDTLTVPAPAHTSPRLGNQQEWS
jgi:hypothetical protein